LAREEREIYNSRLDFFRIEEGAFAARFVAGEAKGRAEGKLENSKKLIAKGFDEKTIFELTGLNAQEFTEYFI
jgi:hypothetical protein